ncbi:GLPGLI family protein [Spirosoma sp. KNUC1025]|uniref:GLPGLI family protein n=1 Tax=Spirosoma sp. KNUC1025 TaxID=2894082 RepID=UPI003865DCF8|nr:GLPGLI family protein [Spirosoma sp. KNUC1025]
MKTRICLVVSCFVAMLITHPILAQTASATWSGQITYEGVRKVDPSQMRIVINGEQVKPGDPNFPTDIPDTRMFGQKVLVSGTYAKESRDEQNAIIRVRGDGGPPQTRNIPRPFTEQIFIDLKDLKKVTILTVGKDAEAKTYQAESTIQRVSGWQLTDQTKKIAGYTCRKATVPFNKETYTVWITNELPITYSPIEALTPETGTVLLIEGSKEQFKATKVDTTSPDASAVKPNAQAQIVTPGQLTELRQKAITDFQQQLQLNERN